MSNEQFCTNCGHQVSEQAIACPSCGAAPFVHHKFCRNCGGGINAEQISCVQCGAGTYFQGSSPYGGGSLEKSLARIKFWATACTVAFVLLFLLGMALNALFIGLAADKTVSEQDRQIAIMGLTLVFSVYTMPISIPGFIAFCFYVRRLWEEIPVEFARTTPTQAVVRLFIPYYNWYWWFVIFLGLFHDMNKAMERWRFDTKFSTEFIRGACIFWPVYAGIGIVAAGVISSFFPTIYVGPSFWMFNTFLMLINAGVTISAIWHVRNTMVKFLNIKAQVARGR